MSALPRTAKTPADHGLPLGEPRSLMHQYWFGQALGESSLGSHGVCSFSAPSTQKVSLD
jgi:hypothetical protein